MYRATLTLTGQDPTTFTDADYRNARANLVSLIGPDATLQRSLECDSFIEFRVLTADSTTPTVLGHAAIEELH